MTRAQVMHILIAVGCTSEQLHKAVLMMTADDGGGGDAFARFWKAWPNKVGKPAAEKAFKKVANELDDILAGIERYVVNKPADRPWLNPATFLNQRRWEDQPAPVSQPFYDARKDGVALLLQEVSRHERQTELAGADVRGVPLLPSFGGDAVGNDQDLFGSPRNLHR